ncbi:hypothetical protein [Pseudomonas guariconensis]|uniref:hypothetical protein n=1 Tax=Pseudomonas guariconensis TaxID=1288410 RepID=UPI0018D5BF1E|nr:hypothetical protein [Pseudomonas guariconensis]MBH3359899.1 hypothetical protein [Pseudomonas guariconensis]
MHDHQEGMSMGYFPAGLRAAVVLLVLLLSSWAEAANVTIGARFRTETGSQFLRYGSSNEWICKTWRDLCKSASENAVDLPISYRKTTLKDRLARQQYYVKVPQPRSLLVRRDGGSETLNLKFEVTHISQYAIVTAESPVASNSPIATRDVQGSCSVVRAPLPPEGLGGTFQWAFWERDSKWCYASSPRGESGDLKVSLVSRTGIGYRLSLPAPTNIVSGIYRGTLVFTMEGAAADFDFGEGVRDLDSTLTVEFEIDLRHELKVEFPPGTDRAVLEPPGGWGVWSGGRAPAQITRDLPFRLTTSGPLTVYATCSDQLPGTSLCLIGNDKGHRVPYFVEMTLPSTVQHGNGPVQRLIIIPDPFRARRLVPVSAIANAKGTLHLTVRGGHVGSMLGYPGSTYAGTVTLIFDAQVL